MEAYLSKHMLVQRKALLGPGANDDKHASILNRLISYRVGGEKNCMAMEPDPRHAEILVEELGLTSGSKAVNTPMEKTEANYVGTPLIGAEATKYRSLCMRLGYMAQDAPRLQ